MCHGNTENVGLELYNKKQNCGKASLSIVQTAPDSQSEHAGFESQTQSRHFMSTRNFRSRERNAFFVDIAKGYHNSYQVKSVFSRLSIEHKRPYSAAL